MVEIPIRMENLKKYFPYFEFYKLNLLKNNKYPQFDICNIALGLLGYLLQEVEIRRNIIAFTEVKEFLKDYIIKMYAQVLEEEELKEFTKYILSKMQNDGAPFMYEIYNIESQKTVEHIIRYITYTYDEVSKKNHYSITSEGIDFYLQTKEFGDESKVTIHLLLLQKMIDDNDYESALNHIINVNTQVRKLILEKKNIIYELLNKGVVATRSLEEYKNKVMSRFEEEKRLFESTKLTVDALFEEYIQNIDFETMSDNEKDVIKVLEKIKEELKNTIELHAYLISETLGLNKQADMILAEKRASSFREKFNFQNFLQGVSAKDDVTLLKNVIDPLLAPKIDKIFSEDKIEDMELCQKKDKKVEDNENVDSEENTALETLNNVIDSRLTANYQLFFYHLFSFSLISEEFKTTDFIEYIKENYSSRPVENPDFITFLIQLYKSAAGDIQDFPAKFHDLHFYVKNYGKHSKDRKEGKDKKDGGVYIDNLIVDVLNESDEFIELKRNKIEIHPIIGEYVQITKTSQITNYIIKKVKL